MDLGSLLGRICMFSVAVLAIGSPFRALHDHLGVKPLLVFLLRLWMAGSAVHPAVNCLSARGMGIVPNLGMTIRTGEVAMNGVLIIGLGHKKRDLPSSGILF